MGRNRVFPNVEVDTELLAALDAMDFPATEDIAQTQVAAWEAGPAGAAAAEGAGADPPMPPAEGAAPRVEEHVL
jgi:hypothetical protein